MLHASPRARGARKYESSRSYIDRNFYLKTLTPSTATDFHRGRVPNLQHYIFT